MRITGTLVLTQRTIVQIVNYLDNVGGSNASNKFMSEPVGL